MCDLRNWTLLSKRVLPGSLLLVLHTGKICQGVHARRRGLSVQVRGRCHARIMRRAQRLWSACGTVDRSCAVGKMTVARRRDLLVREVDLRRRGDLLTQA